MFFLAATPFEQFAIKTLFPITNGYLSISITNAVLTQLLILVSLIFFFGYALPFFRLIPNFLQLIFEEICIFIMFLMSEHLRRVDYKYYPMLVVLFFFVLTANFLGMLPYSFTLTSHIAVTFFVAFSLCIGIFIIGNMYNGVTLYGSFIPSGAPIALAPLLFSIEWISYLSHSFSLAIRLFANMMAGHALLKIISGFAITINSNNVISLILVFPLGIIFALTILEIGIAMLQSYVFVVLSTIYLKDATILH